MLKFIVSPTKKMKDTSDDFEGTTDVIFKDESNELLNYLRSLNHDDLKKIYQVNNKIFNENIERLHGYNPCVNKACMSYTGLQFQYMAPELLDDESLNYLNDHLVILSALYGYVRPNDKIILYRLEMQAKINYKGYDNLYDFWNHKIADLLKDDIIVNLASKEYSDVITPYHKVININFLEESKGKFKTVASHAKMLRGSMVRYAALNKIKNIDELKAFNDFNYLYDEEMSDENNLYFVKR